MHSPCVFEPYVEYNRLECCQLQTILYFSLIWTRMILHVWCPTFLYDFNQFFFIFVREIFIIPTESTNQMQQTLKFTTCHLTLRQLMSYIYMEHPFLMFLDHTQRRSTVGRTPLDEWSARRRDLSLSTHDTHNRQISMPPVGFEPKISAGERQGEQKFVVTPLNMRTFLYLERWRIILTSFVTK